MSANHGMRPTGHGEKLANGPEAKLAQTIDDALYNHGKDFTDWENDFLANVRDKCRSRFGAPSPKQKAMAHQILSGVAVPVKSNLPGGSRANGP